MFMLSEEKPQKVNYFVGLLIFAGPNNNLSILTLEKDDKLYFPACSVLETDTSVQSAAKLLFDLTGVISRCDLNSTGFVDLILGSLHDNPNNTWDGNRSIYSIYGVNLPSRVKGNFVLIQDQRIDDNMHQLMLEVGRKLWHG